MIGRLGLLAVALGLLVAAPPALAARELVVASPPAPAIAARAAESVRALRAAGQAARHLRAVPAPMMATALRRKQIDIAWMLADAPDDDAAEGNEGSGGGDRDESDDPDGLVRLDPTSDRLHYAIVVTADAPWQRVGELLHADRSRVRLALSDTYLARRDGYLALRRARGEDAPRLLPLRRPPAARLDAVRAGRADAAVVLRPHPGLDASDLRALDDPDGLLPRGTLVARVRSDLLETHPELGTTLSP